MTSESESSTIGSEEYKEIEREMERCAEILEEMDRKRVLREKKEKLIQMRKEIERRLKKDSDKGRNKMQEITNKIEQIEENKNRIIARRRRGPTITHQDETIDPDERDTGEIKIEIDIKKEIRKRKKIKITYELDGDKVRRRVEYTDRSGKPKQGPNEIGETTAKEKKSETRKEDRSARKKKDEERSRMNKRKVDTMQDEPSTSKEADRRDQALRSLVNESSESMCF